MHGNERWQNVLPTLPTKTPLHTLPTPRLIIPVLLHHTPFIYYFYFFFLNRQIRRHVRARYFAAVGAVAQVASRFGKELAIGDGHTNGAAETGR
jgi:hypothetical protein